MLFKSALATALSGKLGGIVASHNRGGRYFRGLTIPTNPNSPGQVTVRAMLAFLSGQWGFLTIAQRLAWTTYGQNVPMTNRVGEVIYYTGQQWFIACNVARLRGGFGLVSDGPTIFLQDTLNVVAINAPGGTTDIEVFFSDTDDWVAEDGAGLIVQIGIDVGKTINFYKGPFVFADSVDGNSVTPPAPPVTITSPRPTHVAGNRVFARLRSVRADGRMSPVQIVFDDSI